MSRISDVPQGAYITVLNFIYDKLIIKISESARNRMIFIIFLLFFSYFILFRSAPFYQTMLNHKMISQSIGSVFLILIAALSMNGRVKKIRWRNMLFLPYILFALGLIITGIIHPIGDGYMSFGFMLLIVYPFLYIVWNNRGDYEILFDRIASACMLTGSLYFIKYAYLLISGTDVMEYERHTGGMYNANFLTFLGMSLICCALYYFYRNLMSKRAAKIPALLCSIIAMAIGAVYIAGGMGRSAMIVCFINAIVLIIFLVKNTRPRTRRGILLVIMVVAVIGTGFLLFGEGSGGEEGNDASLFDRLDFKGKTIEQYSSGRMGLWQNYAQHLNMTGNDMDSVDWNALTNGIDTRHAHNNFLEYSFRCGIPVGILAVLLQFIAAVFAFVITLMKKRNSHYELFFVITVIHYSIHSMIDIATVPMGSYSPFFFYLVIMILFPARKRADRAHSRG